MRSTDILPMDDASRLKRARAMGFNTDVVVYHGSRADSFDAFSKDHLGAFTGSASAFLGFYFGSSRENSTNYSGGDPETSKFKDLGGLKEIQAAIMAQCKKENIARSFSVGLSSASAFPIMVALNDTKATIEQIKSAMMDEVNTGFQRGLAKAKEYVEQYQAGAFKPKRDYNTPKFVADQVKSLSRQREIALEVIEGWSEPLVMKDWGWIKAFYLCIRNPYTVDQASGDRQSSFAEIVATAREKGHDGVVILNTFDPKPTDVYVVFEPEQIRAVNAVFDPRHAHTPALMA